MDNQSAQLEKALIERKPGPGLADTVVSGKPVVLLIDDETTQRIVVREALVSDGFAVLEAENERRHMTLFHKAMDGIVLLDAEGRIVDANGAFLRVRGRAVDELRRMTLRELATPESLATVTAWLRRILQGEAVRFEAEYHHKDGHIVPLEIAASRIEIGGKEYVLSFHRDITERRQAEDARRAFEAQLREAQKMEAIGVLAGGIAHDFNNQLTVIKGRVQFLLETLAADHPGRKDAEQISMTVDKGAKLIRQLLDFNRNLKTERSAIDLASFVNEMAPMISMLVGESVQLRFHQSPGAWRARADPGQVEQVITNLVLNARDAMDIADGSLPSGTLTIEVGNVELDEATIRSLGESVRAGAYVMLAISDTGCGMTAEVKSHIFEAFFTTKEPGKGTGLGLPTVLRMVQENRGMITCESQPTQGTTFRIYLPRYESETEEAAPVEGLTLTASVVTQKF